MQKRQLGRTGLMVTPVCLGTMTFGAQNTADEAFAQMDYARENGVNFFDTAELYPVPPQADTSGSSETIVGAWMMSRGARQDIVLATKVVGPAGDMTWFRGGDTRLNRQHIMAAVDASLKRLQTDYIDLYQTHWPQRPVNKFGQRDYDRNHITGREDETIAETLSVMQDLVRAGKILHVGVSNETPWGVMRHVSAADKNGTPRIVSIQNAYSLLNRTFEKGLAEIALQEDVGLLAYAPLAGGALTGKYLDGRIPAGSRCDFDKRPFRYNKPRADDAIRDYVAIAKKYDMHPSTLANAFVCNRPFVTSCIVGATQVDHLKISLAAANVTLTPEMMADIESVHFKNANPCP